MTADEISELLGRNGMFPVNAFIGDKEYSLPSREWINGKFAQAYRKVLDALGLREWKAERNDCDNFAQLAGTYAGILHARTSRRETGLALGSFWYWRGGVEAHAINMAVVNEKSGDELLFWEPQEQEEIKLTTEEKQSCFGFILN